MHAVMNELDEARVRHGGGVGGSSRGVWSKWVLTLEQRLVSNLTL